MRVPKVLMFGDSITLYSAQVPEGMFQLTRRYAGRLDIILRAYSGYNTKWARELVDQGLFAIGPIATTVIFFGSNDAAHPDSGQHVPLADYKRNLTMLAVTAAEYGPVIIVGPAFVDESNPSLTHRRDVDFAAYAAGAAAVAAELQVTFINLRAACAGRRELLSDGLHFSPKGYSVFFQLLCEELDSILGEPDTIPWMVPYWRDVRDSDQEAPKSINK